MQMFDDAEQAISGLHEERLACVAGALLARGVETVLDLGCGTGDLLLRLARESSLARIVGVDRSSEALAVAAQRLRALEADRHATVELQHASFMAPDLRWRGFDAAVLMETIEHLEPGRLSALVHTVFARCRPPLVLITTPNREWNDLLHVLPNGLRHPDHHFEWPRARFASWVRGEASRNGYQVAIHGIGPEHPLLGCPTQMAAFTSAEAPPRME